MANLPCALLTAAMLLLGCTASAGSADWQRGFAAALPPGMPPSLEVAQQAIAQGRIADAVAQARAFLAAGPTSRAAALGYEVLGTALFLDDKPAEATAALRRSVALDSTRAAAWAKLGSIAVAGGDIARGVEWLQTALRLDSNQPLARQRMAAVLEQRGDILGAIAHYEVALAGSRPDDIGIRVALAGLYNMRGRFAGTVHLLQPLGHARLPDARARQVLGTALLATERPAEALTLLLQAVEQAPDEANIVLLAAVAQRQTGQLEPALANLRRLLAARPGWTTAAFQLGLALISRSDYAAGRAAIEAAGRGDPLEVEQQQVFTGPLALGTNPSEAVAIFAAMAARPTARLADTALLARVSQAAGQPEGVERAWRAAVARFPTDAAAHWRLINMLAAEQKYPAAMQAFDAAQRLVPDDPSLLLTASMVQARAGRPAEALALANRLVAAAPTDTLARLNLAGLQQATGDKTAAATTYRGVLASQPDNIFALNNLALLQTESDPAGAVALARRAQRLQPRDPEVLDTLAAALLKLGRGGEAVATMRESVAIDPANPRRRYRLALVQEASGDLPGARATLNELVNAAPFPDLDAARAALRRLSR